MEPDRLPALVPALGVLLGALLGLRLHLPQVLLIVALGACGTALSGRSRRLLLGVALGWLAAAIAVGGECGVGLDVDRPVEVVGRVAGHWRAEEGGWATIVAVERRAQRRARGGPGAAAGALGVRRGGGELWVFVPGAEPPPDFGSRLRLRGYLRRSPGYANAIAVPPGPWRLRLASRRLLAVAAEPPPWALLAGRLRGRLENALAAAARASDPLASRGAAEAIRDAAGSAAFSPGLALVRALVLGDASRVPESWRRGLRRSGLSHLLAVSGLHVGLVAGLCWGIALPLPRPLRRLLTVAGVVLYLLAVGPRPSLLRAAVMGTLAMAALLARRSPSAGNALAVAAAGLVIARPALIDDVGFRLTVAATGGLVFLAPRLVAAWGGHRAPGGGRPPHRGRQPARGLRSGTRWRSFLVVPLAATCGAQIASLPFAAPVFHLVSWASPLVNLAAVPFTAVFLAVGLAWTALALAAPAAAAGMLPMLDGLAAGFGLPAIGPPGAWGVVPVAAPWLVAAAIAASLAAGASWPRRFLVPGLLSIVLLIPAMRWGRAAARHGREGIEVAVLDVGQGDAILLRDGPRAVLVDGGGWRHGDLGGRVLVPALVGEGLDRLDAVLLSHPDRDHCGGLVDLASYMTIGAVWTAPGWDRDGCGRELAQALAGRPDADPAAVAGLGSRWVELTAGNERRVGRWRLTVLHPDHSELRRAGRAQSAGREGGRNDLSLVVLAAAAGRRTLLTGDVEARSEHRLLRVERQRLAADFLKVAHHGSRTSSGTAFLAAVGPRLALVSAGTDNRYGHPAPEVVARLRRQGAQVLRTDAMGRILLSWGVPQRATPSPGVPSWAPGATRVGIGVVRGAPPPRRPAGARGAAGADRALRRRAPLHLDLGRRAPHRP